MSDVTQHLDCLLQRERQKNEMLQAQNQEWQARYEALHGLYVGMMERLIEQIDQNREAV